MFLGKEASQEAYSFVDTPQEIALEGDFEASIPLKAAVQEEVSLNRVEAELLYQESVPEVVEGRRQAF